MEALRSSPPLCALLSRSSPPLRRLLLLSRSLPISSIPPRAISVRCSSDRIVARPSSELRSGRVSDHTDDPKMRALRNLFTRPGIGIDAYIVPSEDSHQSEFIADCFQRRAYISDFTGSSGTAIVTADKAALWTDGRYFLQAEKELSRSWTLMRSGNPGVPTTAEWLNDILDSGCKIGIDPFLFSYDAAEDLKKCISANNHELVYLRDLNLVDEIWKESRPQPPKEPIRVHPIKYAGVDVSSKLSLLRSQLTKEGCTAIVISMLDEIAWLLNLRGNDVRNSPVFYAYLIVEKDSAKLFVDNDKVEEEVTAHLTRAGVELKQYELILSEIESLAEKGSNLWLDTSKTNAAIVAAFESASARHLQSITTKKTQPHPVGEPSSLYKSSPVTIAKAVKNEEELQGMRSSHLRDAAALAEFWAWLEEKVHTKLTEVDVANKLLEFRLKQSDFLDTSFDTISGYGANGAIIHYRPCHESCSVVGDKSLFLLDSGAQYVDGTTDVTRTVHFGEPTMRQKECFTRVLQGHIALDQAIFPENTPGFVLDVLARSSLWKIGLDYRHGTGHGVGAALNVHEGPQGISARYGNMTPLQKGMIVSNEPGYYEDHSFGIRIENLLIVKEVDTPNRFGGVTYLGFEKLTFVPIQRKLIDVALLSKAEISWINDYHSQVWEKVCPLVHGSALEWLRENTRPLVE